MNVHYHFTPLMNYALTDRFGRSAPECNWMETWSSYNGQHNKMNYVSVFIDLICNLGCMIEKLNKAYAYKAILWITMIWAIPWRFEMLVPQVLWFLANAWSSEAKNHQILKDETWESQTNEWKWMQNTSAFLFGYLEANRYLFFLGYRLQMQLSKTPVDQTHSIELSGQELLVWMANDMRSDLKQERFALWNIKMHFLIKSPNAKTAELCQHLLLFYDGTEHLSLKIQYVEFDINAPLHQQYIKNLMSKIYDIELLICMLL